MTAFDYGEARDDADDLIEEFGQTVSVRRVTNSGTAWEPTQTPTDYVTKAAQVAFNWRQMQDANILATDRRWLIAAGPLTALGLTAIMPGDLLIVEGAIVGKIMPLDPVKPAGVVVVYDCQVRA